MIQTFALLLDSYRELNAKKLFWIVLALSGLVVVLFASLGLSGGAVTFFGWTTPMKSGFLSLVHARPCSTSGCSPRSASGSGCRGWRPSSR